LRERGVEFDVVNYLKTPLDRATLQRLVRLVGDPMSCVRTGDAAFAATGLNPAAQLDAEGVVDLLCKHPELMQRPIIVRGERAVIARPSEKVLGLLDTPA
jgi:arsenate reductase (glutaredoxin)